MPRSKTHLSRRQLLAGAGAGAAALLFEQRGVEAQTPSPATVVFSHTTVVTVDAVHHDVALAVAGDTIAAIGPTDQVLKTYPRAEVYDGRGKALFPGLINCHAHLAATLARGFNEDFGFPNSAKLAVQPASLLQGEEATLMVTIGALEAIRTGTTTIVENSGGIARSRRRLGEDGAALCVRRVGSRQRECGWPDVAGRARQESGAAILTQVARGRPPAHQRPVRQAWHGTIAAVSACFRPLRWPRPHRQSCCRPFVPLPRSTTSATRST